MEITIEGILIHSPNNIERKLVTLTQENYLLVREKLKYERYKIIAYFRALKEAGHIKSIFRPKNKKIQGHLDDLCLLKSRMKKSIEKIDAIYK